MIEERVGQAASGDVSAAVADEAWARMTASVDGPQAQGLRVRIPEAGILSGTVLGQVSALAASRRVRMQATGPECDGAIDAL
jgi:hypothetical protein